MKEAPHFEIDFSGGEKSEIPQERLSVEKVAETFLSKYENLLSMEQHGTAAPQKKEEVEAEYISFVCECSSEEYGKLNEYVLDRLMCGIIQRQIPELAANKERNKFEIERLSAVFVLYRTAKAEREKKEARDLEDNFYQEDQAEILHEKPSFEKEMDILLSQYEEFLSMELQGISPEGDNVNDSFVPKRKEQLEVEYTSLVCECSPEEYEKWKKNILDRLMCGIIQAQIRELGSNKERDKFEIERLFSVFVLYRTAKAKRNEKQKTN